MGYGMPTQCVDVLGNGLGYVNVPLSQRQQSFLCCRAFGGLEPTQQRRVEMAVAWLSNVPIPLPTLLSHPPRPALPTVAGCLRSGCWTPEQNVKLKS